MEQSILAASNRRADELKNTIRSGAPRTFSIASRQWMVGDQYGIADIAIFPWVRNLVGFYGAGDLVGFAEFKQVARVLDAFVARPAVVRGLDIPKR